MRLSAIIPATDSPPTLSACEAAIAAAAAPPDEVIVVTEPAGLGPGATRNLGAERATGDVLVFVDSDVAVHPDAFMRLREVLGGDASLAGVIGSYDDAPAARGVVSGFRNLLHHHVHQQAAGPVASFWTGLGAIRRDRFVELGGFDAAQRWMEDVELGMRLADAGAAIELDPGLLGKHLKRWTLAEMLRTDVLRRGVPWVELMLRRRQVPAELNLSWRHRAGALSWLAAAGALVARRPAVAGLSVAVAVGANRSFYSLLLRRLGVRGVLAGVPLHGAHYLSGVVAVPLGVAGHVWKKLKH